MLLVSITTMKSINTSGAPSGTRRSNIYFAFCNYPKIISLSHKVIAVSIKRLIPVQIYANNPRKLLRLILRNNEIKINSFPSFSFRLLGWFLFLLVALLRISFILIEFRVGINQIADEIRSSSMAVLV